MFFSPRRTVGNKLITVEETIAQIIR